MFFYFLIFQIFFAHASFKTLDVRVFYACNSGNRDGIYVEQTPAGRYALPFTPSGRFDGISAYYGNISNHSHFLSTTMKDGNISDSGGLSKDFPTYRLSSQFYNGCISLKNQDNERDVYENTVIKSPLGGALFCTNHFFGIIDKHKREAFLFDQYGTKKIDFSALVPWEVAKGRIEVFHSTNAADFEEQNIIDGGSRADYLCVNFYQDSYGVDKYHFKPRLQAVYKLKGLNGSDTIKVDEFLHFVQESLLWKKWICWKLMALMQLIDKTVDTTYFELDRDVSHAWSALIIKGLILNAPFYPCFYFMIKCLQCCSKNNFFGLGLTSLAAYLIFCLIGSVYMVNFNSSINIVAYFG